MEKEKLKIFESIENLNKLEHYNALQTAIKALKEEIKKEYHLDRNDFFLNYARPIEKKVQKNPGTELLDMLISGLDLENELGDMKKDLFNSNTKKLVPQIQTFRLSGYQSIKILNFLLKMYQEEAEELFADIKKTES